jgi:ATPase subunit of ABC transporter with duplicated ATPase domains
MYKNSVSFLLSFFLFLGAVTFSEGVEAKRVRHTSTSKTKKRIVKQHKKAHHKVAKAKAKASHKVAKNKKFSNGKKRSIAKSKRSSSVNRKIASVNSKKMKKNKVKRKKANLPREYGPV